jgi:hypothetical protein
LLECRDSSRGQLTDALSRERRVKEIIAEKAKKKKEAKEAAEAAIAKARQVPPPLPPPPPLPQPAQQLDYEKSEGFRDAVSSTGRVGNAGWIPKQRRDAAEMPPDLSFAAQHATAVHRPLETSGLARLLSGVDMGRYARGLEDLGN